MPDAADPPRDLLFGLLALQNGLIDQAQLVAAYHAWTRDRSRPIGDILLGQGALDPPRRDLLDALLVHHLERHGGDPERSLAAINARRTTEQSLRAVGDPVLDATLTHLGPPAGSATVTAPGSADTVSVGAAGDGVRFRVLRPHAGGASARCSWRSTPS